MPGNDWALVAGVQLPKALSHIKKSLSLTMDGL